MSISDLPLPDSEHLSTACRAYTLSCWFAILHSYGPGIPHFPFGTALHTICLHWLTSFFDINNKPFILIMSISGLALPYSEHLRTTRRAYTLSCWFTILHSYGPGILRFPFGTALHTVCLHFAYLLSCVNYLNNKLFIPIMSIASLDCIEVIVDLELT